MCFGRLSFVWFGRRLVLPAFSVVRHGRRLVLPALFFRMTDEPLALSLILIGLVGRLARNVDSGRLVGSKFLVPIVVLFQLSRSNRRLQLQMNGTVSVDGRIEPLVK